MTRVKHRQKDIKKVFDSLTLEKKKDSITGGVGKSVKCNKS